MSLEGGLSGSAASICKRKVSNSLTFCGPTGVMTGGLFTSFTRHCEALLRRESRLPVTRDTHRHEIRAWPLLLSGSPVELTGGRINTAAKWCPGRERKGELLRRDVRVDSLSSESKRGAFIDSDVGDRRQLRRPVGRQDGHCEGPRGRPRWDPVVRHANRDRVASRPLPCPGHPNQLHPTMG